MKQQRDVAVALPLILRLVDAYDCILEEHAETEFTSAIGRKRLVAMSQMCSRASEAAAAGRQRSGFQRWRRALLRCPILVEARPDSAAGRPW
jgi:hypothetical protein